LRFVSHALFEFRDTAEEIFAKEPDLAQDIAEGRKFIGIEKEGRYVGLARTRITEAEVSRQSR
jgi:hypothetical protein